MEDIRKKLEHELSHTVHRIRQMGGKVEVTGIPPGATLLFSDAP